MCSLIVGACVVRLWYERVLLFLCPHARCEFLHIRRDTGLPHSSCKTSLVTRRRLKAFTRDVLVYVRTILNGVGQLSSTWVGTICERETEVQHWIVKGHKQEEDIVRIKWAWRHSIIFEWRQKKILNVMLTEYRNFRPSTRTADYPHWSILAKRGKKNQQITRVGG